MQGNRQDQEQRATGAIGRQARHRQPGAGAASALCCRRQLKPSCGTFEQVMASCFDRKNDRTSDYKGISGQGIAKSDFIFTKQVAAAARRRHRSIDTLHLYGSVHFSGRRADAR